jgi:prepilin peptidase CpaA
MFHALPEQVTIICFLGLLAWAACNDAIQFEIPDGASLGLVLLYPIFVIASPIPIDWFWAILVAAAVFAAGLLLFTTGRFGGGDVKLLTATALWAGPKLILPFLFAMSITGGVLALIVWVVHWVRSHRLATTSGHLSLTTAEYAVPTRLPYGVAIAAGAGLVGLRLAAG